MLLWVRLFDFSIGPVNSTLINLGIFNFRNAPQWMGGTTLTIPAMVIIEVWWGLGYHTMFFLAGLAMIPRELTEAARIDGANEWQLFRFVTVPRLYPILSILVVLRFGTAMAVIEEYLLVGGGANNRGSPTYTWTVYMWTLAFKTGNWLQGYAAAIGWIGAIFMIIVVIFLLYIFRVRD
jgi:multiple sugar transport system permease protein